LGRGLCSSSLLRLRQAAAARSANDIDEDPIEMAVIAALDAQEMLPALSTFIVQAKSTPGLTDECQTPLRLVVSSGLYAMVWNKNKKGLGIYKG
jgi:hypothetical protein